MIIVIYTQVENVIFDNRNNNINMYSYVSDSGRSTLMESNNCYQRDLQEELSNASSINGPYHSAKTVFTLYKAINAT